MTDISGALSATEAGDALSAASVSIVGGVLSATEAADTLIATSVSLIAGALNITEGDDTLISSVVSLITGSANFTEANDACSVIGAAHIIEYDDFSTPLTQRQLIANFGLPLVSTPGYGASRPNLPSGGDPYFQ